MRENGWVVRKKERKTTKKESAKKMQRRFSLPNSTNLYRIRLCLIEQLNYPVNTVSVSNTVPITAEHTACGHTHTYQQLWYNTTSQAQTNASEM